MHTVKVRNTKALKLKEDRVFDHNEGIYKKIPRDFPPAVATIEFGEMPLLEASVYDNQTCILLSVEEFNLLKERRGE